MVLRSIKLIKLNFFIDVADICDIDWQTFPKNAASSAEAELFEKLHFVNFKEHLKFYDHK